MKRRIDIFILIALAAVLTGCGGGTKHPWDTLEKCEQENIELSLRAQALEAENDRLTEQVDTLSKLKPATRLKTLDTLDKIRIGKRTGFYDKDNDSTNETLVVYLEPTDTAHDTIKAVGQAKIELWDLNATAGQAKLTEWTLEPEDMHTTWAGNIFNSYYRIKLPLEISPDQKKDYTVKVSFTDYLSGKILTDQKVIPLK